MDSSTLKPHVQSETLYYSISANRHENNISCSDKFLLYSRSKCPIIHNLETHTTASILSGKEPNSLFHTEEVNGQSFVSQRIQPNDSGDDYIISTSYDKSAIIWQVHREQSGDVASEGLFALKSPDQSAFTSRSSFINSQRQFVSITTTLSGSLTLWVDQEIRQTLKIKFICFDAKIQSVYNSETQNYLNFLFLAGSDNIVHVFEVNSTSLDLLFDLSGHSDWIKCLDLLELAGRDNEFLLASASQDSFIRVWYLKLIDHELDKSLIRTKVSPALSSFQKSGKTWKLSATLETVLSGHEGFVHGLCWFKKQSEPNLQLISCSEDKTIIIWKSTIAPVETKSPNNPKTDRYDICPASAEIWKEVLRVGETGETNLPFLGVCLSPNERTFYSNSLKGAIHSWTLNEDDQWVAAQTITGHFGPVTDLAWERSGSYLLSCSLDKTCRLHTKTAIDQRWHEIVRPQAHGYEINCLSSINAIKFVSGSDEKTIRAFEATKFFLKSFESLAESKLSVTNESKIDILPLHAQLPALGLSNRGQNPFEMNPEESGGSDSNWYGTSKLMKELSEVDCIDKLPIEEILLQSTLWWESNKIFGHMNELHALAVNSDGSCLASASKANKSDSANILIWECSQFRKTAVIEHHSLTVTRLKFSPDDKYLLSVSRDRTWSISQSTGKLRPSYVKITGTSKSNSVHERIIWDCCWTQDSRFFMTVSRDLKAILWSMNSIQSQVTPIGGDADVKPVIALNSKECIASSHTFNVPIQAVDSVEMADSSNLFAFGLEDGSLEIYIVSVVATNASVKEWLRIRCFPKFHHMPIRRLAFQPSATTKDHKTNPNSCVLASASDDCIVRLTKFTTFGAE